MGNREFSKYEVEGGGWSLRGSLETQHITEQSNDILRRAIGNTWKMLE